MKDILKNNGLKPRDQFFKKVTNTLFFVLGAIALLQLPIIVKTLEENTSCYSNGPMSCFDDFEDCFGQCYSNISL